MFFKRDYRDQPIIFTNELIFAIKDYILQITFYCQLP